LILCIYKLVQKLCNDCGHIFKPFIFLDIPVAIDIKASYVPTHNEVVIDGVVLITVQEPLPGFAVNPIHTALNWAGDKALTSRCT